MGDLDDTKVGTELEDDSLAPSIDDNDDVVIDDSIEDDDTTAPDADEPPVETKEEETFMSMDEVPDELKPAFASMQKSFGRAMEGIKDKKDKLELADKLMADPELAIQYLAEKAGIDLKAMGGKKEDEPTPPGDESLTDTDKYVLSIVEKQFGPVLKEMKEFQARQLAETQLSKLTSQHPDWKLYENDMEEIIKEYPVLSRDLEKVYGLAKQKAGQVDTIKRQAGKKSTSASIPSSGRHEEKVKVTDFDSAFKAAEKELGLS